jgi:glyoxylate reductase
VAEKILVAQPVFDQALDFLRKHGSIDANLEDRVLPRAELLARLQGVRGVVTLLTDIMNKEVLEALPDIRVISNVAVGFNNIDVETATRLGILITNTPGVLTETTADFAWTLLMAAARRVVEGDNFARSGEWKAWGLKMLLGRDVYGKTLGIVGFGRIGQAMARRGKGFDMKIQFFDPEITDPGVARSSGIDQVTLEALLATSDYVSVHVPLFPSTTHLMNDRTFAMMKPDAILINTARGPVVDEKALVRALKAGKIGGAGLDVFENEPAIEPELLTMHNVVLAPHISSASNETRLRMCMMAAENVVAGLKGERPPNLVNPEVWDRRRR